MIGTENPKICILVNFVQKDRACRYHVNAMFQDSEPEVRISRRKGGVRQKLWANQLQMSLAHTPLIDEGINVNTQFDGGVMRGAGTLEYCRMKGIGVQTWSPLQKGFFGGVFLGDEEYAELNRELDRLAEQYGVTAGLFFGRLSLFDE